MDRPSAAVRVLALLVLVATATCRRGAPAAPAAPLRLGEVTVRLEGGDATLDEGGLAARLRAQFQSSGLAVAGRADADASTPTVRIAGRVATEVVEAGHKGLCRAAVSLAITTRPSDARGALNEEISAGGEERFDVAPATDRRAIAARLAERTASDLLGAFLQRMRLGAAGPAELQAALASDAAPGVREEAIRQVGARHLTDEVPRLLALLDDQDEGTRDAALGALIVMRDERAVAKLTRDRSLRDRHEMLKILDAISLIGGKEAEEYLAFVADSHDDADIRQAASEARDRLRRRAGSDAR